MKRDTKIPPHKTLQQTRQVVVASSPSASNTRRRIRPCPVSCNMLGECGTRIRRRPVRRQDSRAESCSKLFNRIDNASRRQGPRPVYTRFMIQLVLLCLVCRPSFTFSLLRHGGTQRSCQVQRHDRYGTSSFRAFGSHQFLLSIHPSTSSTTNVRALAASLSSNFDDDSYSCLTSSEADLIGQAQNLQQSAQVLVQRNQFRKAYSLLNNVVGRLGSVQHNERTRLAFSEVVDDIVQSLCGKAFRRNALQYDNVIQAVSALQLQLSCADKLSDPYSTVPKRTLSFALNALTSLHIPNSNASASAIVLKLSFRILQRLLTGVGVRPAKDSRNNAVHEREINQVLNVFANVGRMDMAHRIVALQERSRHAPPITAVAYSILIKGYGRQKDLDQIEQVWRQAKKSKVQPDVIFLNSLMDAYINCKDLPKAQAVFAQMKRQSPSNNRSAMFRGYSLPWPNQRTYNIMLKGFANAGAYDKAIQFSDEMVELQNWDPVTTNTLVRAAVIAQDFNAAERLLAKHTVDPSELEGENVADHPNVEAYTQLLDGYAKVGAMSDALAVMRTMNQRNVQPNILTYTCLIAGFGRTLQLDEAKKMLTFMAQKGHPPSTVTYNALMSGMLEGVKLSETEIKDDPGSDIDVAADQSLSLLRDMMNNGIRPNSVTATILVETLGQCEPARIEPATLLVDMLEKKKLIPAADIRVMTAFIRSCGAAGHMQSAVKYFRKMKAPDLVAINAFIDTCHRCGRDDLGADTFNFFFLGHKASRFTPDVVTYSVLIKSALKNGDKNALREAQTLYSEMKKKWKVCPDTGMIDALLKAAILMARKTSLDKRDVAFIASIIRDAERLSWPEGQLDRRKRAVRSILGDRLRDAFLDKQRLGSLSQDEDDELFKRKGWNRVDSGFRLWGKFEDYSSAGKGKDSASVDKFLDSHGWNNVDSGFRLL